MNEADLPAEQPATQANPWISGADGDPGGPQGAEAAPRQGTQAAHRYHPRKAARLKQSGDGARRAGRFPRSHRLRKRSEFLVLQRDGRRRVTADFVMLTRERQAGPSRLGVTTSRRIGHAPARNRVRRLVREFFRRHRQELQSSMDILIIARPGAADLSFGQVEHQLTRALQLNG